MPRPPLTLERRIVAIALGLALGVVLLGGLVAWSSLSTQRRRAADRRVCDQIARLDGKSYEGSVVSAIHDAGAADHDRLGTIAADVDGRSTPGELSLSSTDADYITAICESVGVEPEHVDS
jgi:hypothetical protein